MMPFLLLMLLSVALSTGGTIVYFVIRRSRLKYYEPQLRESDHRVALKAYSPLRMTYAPRPSCWLAVKSTNLLAVQTALGLHNPKPCSWVEGLAGEEKLFIAPPVRGWVLVIGSGLPDPSEDVDACFRFLLNLSRKLGHVQFFSASRILQHHAWVRVERGRIVRAYAWAGKTIWKQGARTVAEKELALKCFDYGDAGQGNSFGQPDGVLTNVDKVPLLAARWSLDPAGIDERFLEHEQGVAGEPSRRY